ncbi:MAG: TIGR01777 family oxidoreductase [Longimicrobiales bacterium]|nr:TIGR01777 family oxidoreductase [Longimicrobiales bacterium]
MSTLRLIHRAELDGHSPEEVFAWHERPGALERLTPPWAHVEVEHREGGIRDGARVVLRIHHGPASFRWELRHRDFEPGRQFRDEQVSGPLKSWVHTHRFLPRGGGGTVLEDEIELEAPGGLPVGPLYLRGELARLFAFRYRRLFTDLARHREHGERARLTVAVTGASGLVGQALTHFLTTGGHRVIRLVRARGRAGEGVLHWNPRTGEIDAEGLRAADAVVHLAGASIAGGRWTDDRKKVILESRVQGTGLLARTLADLGSEGPRVLVSSSAVGFYGNRGDERLDETAAPGRGFLADVARAWEAATEPAARAGVRVVHLRTGVVISPAGGALGQMLLPFKMGLGGRLGSGRQYFSWVDLDDLVAAVLHALYHPTLAGPLNVTAPNAVTNAAFTDALGRVLGRPTVLPVPALAVKVAFGQLGEEALLWGQRVVPTKLDRSGFRFFYEGVEDSLRFQLGRAEAISPSSSKRG